MVLCASMDLPFWKSDGREGDLQWVGSGVIILGVKV